MRQRTGCDSHCNHLIPRAAAAIPPEPCAPHPDLSQLCWDPFQPPGEFRVPPKHSLSSPSSLPGCRQGTHPFDLFLLQLQPWRGCWHLVIPAASSVWHLFFLTAQLLREILHGPLIKTSTFQCAFGPHVSLHIPGMLMSPSFSCCRLSGAHPCKLGCTVGSPGTAQPPLSLLAAQAALGMMRDSLHSQRKGSVATKG